MSILTEIEERAMCLTKRERGQLVSKLIESLGVPFGDEEDEDLAALAAARSKEMDEDPDIIMSEDDFWRSLEEFGR